MASAAAVVSQAAKAVSSSESFSLEGWDFQAQIGPILATEEFNRWESELFTLPEMVFGDNCLQITHKPSGLTFRFRPREALECCAGAVAPAELPYIDKWKDKSSMSMEGWKSCKIEECDTNFDWTYCTSYKGDIFIEGSDANPVCEVSESAAIDYDLLRQPDEILFHKELILYEDELHDNGMSTLSIRMRVMPSSFFVLMRLFLRVDNSLVRIHDTRLFHKFGEPTCIRETKVLQKPWALLVEETQGVIDKQGKEGPYADPNMLVPHLYTLDFKNEVIQMM